MRMILRSYKKKLKHEQVREYLLPLIRESEHGALLPSQVALADRFGVNHLTVRRALRSLEEDGMIYRIHGKGTFVRKVSTCEERLTFLVMLYHNFDLQPHAFRSRALLSMLEQSSRAGFGMHVSGIPEQLEDMHRLDFAGVIGISPAREFYGIYYQLKERKRPVLLINRKEPDFNYITTDHEYGAARITRHFIAQGHTKICFAGFSPQNKFLHLRYTGYHSAMAEHGLDAEAALRVAGEDESTVAAELAAVLDTSRPTALIVPGTHLLATALTEIRKRQLRIPEEIELATFDEVDRALAEHDRIHEIVQPTRRIGQETVNHMASLASGEEKSVQMTIEPEFRIKGFDFSEEKGAS
jgi:GntR family transcriptional regulator of arabinose operon